MWRQWLNAILGVWLIAIPFIGLASAAFTWALVLTGLVIALAALWSVGEESSERSYTHELEMRLEGQH